MTKDMALKMLDGEDVSHDYAMNLNEKGKVSMDYVFGRCCKTYIVMEKDYVKVTISTVDRNPTKILELAQDKLND